MCVCVCSQAPSRLVRWVGVRGGSGCVVAGPVATSELSQAQVRAPDKGDAFRCTAKRVK